MSRGRASRKSRANSPGWGVMTVPGRSIQRLPSPPSGRRHPAPGDRPTPGPATCPRAPPAGHRRPRARRPSQVCTMASGTWAAISARTSGSVSTVTRPAPTRRAPRAASTAAPLMPRLPARMATWPKLPLWGSQLPGGQPGAFQQVQTGLRGSVQRNGDDRDLAAAVPGGPQAVADLQVRRNRRSGRAARPRRNLRGAGIQARGQIQGQHRQATGIQGPHPGRRRRPPGAAWCPGRRGHPPPSPARSA